VFYARNGALGKNAKEDFPFVSAVPRSTQLHFAGLIKVCAPFVAAFILVRHFSRNPVGGAASQKAEKLFAINGELTRTGRKQIAASWKIQ